MNIFIGRNTHNLIYKIGLTKAKLRTFINDQLLNITGNSSILSKLERLGYTVATLARE